MNSDNIWALRGVASRMGQVGHLAVVALCDDLLAARKERDAAESALENIRSARNANADAAMVLVRVREAAGARSGTDIVEAVRGLRALADSAAGHAEVVAAMLGYIGDVRRAAGLRVGEGLVRFVGEMRKRLEANEALERVGDDIMAEVRNAAGAKLGDDIVEIVKELRRESEGLYRFKVRIREALGVEKGVDMAEVIRERARVHENWKKDFQCVENRARCLNNTIAEIGKVVGSKDLRAEAVLLHVKNLPTAVTELRSIARNGLGYLPSFLAVGMCEGLADDVLRKKLEARIRGDLDQLRNRPVAVDQHVRDALYKVCEAVGIAWPGEYCTTMDQIYQEMVAGIKNGEGSKHNDAMMRQNLAEKTAECEKLQARVRVLESTIREHEKDLKVIEELQDEQTKLNALLMRMAEGKPVTVTRGGITFVPNQRIPAGWVVAVGQ